MPSPTKFRPDIQALRGLAVLVVLFYHAQIGGLEAGYLGVDIFYVISGYLITGLIRAQVEAGHFSFGAFYFRRAKRLLPSSFLVLLATGASASYFLTGIEFRDFIGQLVGSVTFTSNMVLLDQAGYFSGAADLKPLLHMWSLSIEEQYYLLLPAALVFAPRRWWVRGSLAVLLGSLVLCLALVRWAPETAFYLLPTRGWELALGSFGALALGGAAPGRAVRILLWPSVTLLLVLPVLPIGAGHPGLDAVLACVATLVVILCRAKALNGTLPVRALARVGDFSYSLYLVHWPLFAYAQNVYFSSTVPVEVRAGLLLLSLVLGYGLYRFVEAPIRRAEIVPTRRLVGATIAASAALVVVPLGIAQIDSPDRDYAHIRRVNYGFGAACEYGTAFEPRAACRDADEPRILVWGDSFAMHLVPGIAAATDRGVMQATRSVCGPFLKLAPMDAIRGRRWAESCLDFNRSVLAWLAGSPVEAVVLSSPFDHYMQAGARTLRTRGDGLVEIGGDVAATVAAMAETVDAVRALGKRVVVIAPPPRGSFDIGLCLERRDSGKLLLGEHRDCTLGVADYHRAHAPVLEFLRRLPGEADVAVIRFDDLLCADGTCAVMLDGTFLYRDPDHFSVDGIRVLAGRMGLGEMIFERAR